MRLFVAVWPPPPIVDALVDLPRPELPGLRWTTPEQWHVTLRFIGSVAGEQRHRFDAAWDALVLPVSAQARMGPATAWFGRHVLHVPVGGLDELAATVRRATADVCETPGARPFAGHITLARAKDRGSQAAALAGLAGVVLRGSWDVDELTLVSSRTEPDGARYEVLRRRLLG